MRKTLQCLEYSTLQYLLGKTGDNLSFQNCSHKFSKILFMWPFQEHPRNSHCLSIMLARITLGQPFHYIIQLPQLQTGFIQIRTVCIRTVHFVQLPIGCGQSVMNMITLSQFWRTPFTIVDQGVKSQECKRTMVSCRWVWPKNND